LCKQPLGSTWVSTMILQKKYRWTVTMTLISKEPGKCKVSLKGWNNSVPSETTWGTITQGYNGWPENWGISVHLSTTNINYEGFNNDGGRTFPRLGIEFLPCERADCTPQGVDIWDPANTCYGHSVPCCQGLNPVNTNGKIICHGK